MPVMSLIQVPYDSGWRERRMGRGPSRLLELGAVEAVERAGVGVDLAEARFEGDFSMENGTTFALLQAIAARAREATSAGRFPLVLSGNCDSTVGAVAGLGRERVGLVWFDGHADFNTPETTESGFLDGMGLAMAVGHCWGGMCGAIPGFAPLAEEQVALVGGRDLDRAEGERLRGSKLAHVTEAMLREQGTARALEGALASWSGGGTGAVEAVYLHIDMDVHDAELAPANPLQPPEGGLSPREVRECVQVITEAHPLAGVSLTAYDPGCDPEGKGADAALALLELIAGTVREQRA